MIIYFDTETSGLHPGQICQLSYIMQSEKETKAKNFFFTVDYVEESAYLVHGFSVSRLFSLSDGKRFSDHFPEIKKDFLSADMVVAHNFSFDCSFMRTEFERLGEFFNVRNCFCTMKKSTPICKLSRHSGCGYKYPKLSELCQYFGVEKSDIINTCSILFQNVSDFHDARFDTTALYLIANEGMKKEEAFSSLKDCL